MICKCVGKINIIQVCRKQVAKKKIGGKKSSTLLPQLQWYKPNIPYTQAASPRFETNTGWILTTLDKHLFRPPYVSLQMPKRWTLQ